MGYAAYQRTPWGFIPNTSGRTFYVSPGDSYTADGEAYSASDNNDGLSPARALRTVDRAWNRVDSDGDVGDNIVLIPGTHTVQTTSVAADVPGVTMQGIPNGRGNILRPRTILTTDITADEIMNVTAANIEVAYLDLRPITASDAIDLTAAADGFHLHNCRFDLATPAVSTSTIGVTLAAAEGILLEDFAVICDGAQGDAVVATGVLDSVIRNFVMIHTAGTWASAILCGAATSGLLIDRGQFVSYGTAITATINGTGATIAGGVQVTDCRFGRLAVAIENFGSGEVEPMENYDGDDTGGAKFATI